MISFAGDDSQNLTYPPFSLPLPLPLPFPLSLSPSLSFLSLQILRTGSAGSRNSTSPHTSFHADSTRSDHNAVYPQPPSVQFGGATVRDASPRGRQPPPPFSVDRPLPVPLPKPPTPLARLHGEDEDDEVEYDAGGRMTHVELFPGHSTPRWFADMLEEVTFDRSFLSLFSCTFTQFSPSFHAYLSPTFPKYFPFPPQSFG
jgi:hypothetical protein